LAPQVNQCGRTGAIYSCCAHVQAPRSAWCGMHAWHVLLAVLLRVRLIFTLLCLLSVFRYPLPVPTRLSGHCFRCYLVNSHCDGPNVHWCG